MKSYLLVGLIAMFLVVGVFSGCTKKGKVGPRGQQGPEGPPGPQGTEQGPQGPPGVNDPKSSVKSSDWNVYSFSKDGDWWITSIADTLISSNVLDNSVIIVYMKNTNNVIHELNYFNDDLTINADFEAGKIAIQSSYDASVDSFKYVIIPPSK